jgi:hypothetical protein
MTAFASFNQKLPTVTVSGATSGSFTVEPYSSGSIINTASGNSGTVGVSPIYEGRAYRFNHDTRSSGLPSYPSIVGDATISAPSEDLDGNSVSTRVHYTFNNRDPGPVASSALAVASPFDGNSDATIAHVNEYQRGVTRISSGSILVINSRPGSNLCTIKLRTYKLATQHIRGEDIFRY